MWDNKLFKNVSISAFVVVAIVLSSNPGWAYGGGGGSEGSGQNSGSGASISTNDMPSYFSRSDGITDHASYQEAQEEAFQQEIKERRDGWSDDAHWDSVSSGLAVSAAAWDETLDVPPSVRRLAMVLETMMMDGALSPKHAFTLLTMYNLGRYRNQQR